MILIIPEVTDKIEDEYCVELHKHMDCTTERHVFCKDCAWDSEVSAEVCKVTKRIRDDL